MQDNQNGVNDDELNQMIANLRQQQTLANNNSNVSNVPNMQPLDSTTQSTVAPTSESIAKPEQVVESVNAPVATQPVHAPVVKEETDTVSAPTGINLEGIKKQAINELRPLVDKLDLQPADKFDTLLLLIRTTDDQSLIPAAHEAAAAISDESRRAQALLDIIKEIDFFGHKG